MALKAVFFGMSQPHHRQAHPKDVVLVYLETRVLNGRLTERESCDQLLLTKLDAVMPGTDMDDTLVLTSEADTKACAAVGKLAHKLEPKVLLFKPEIQSSHGAPPEYVSRQFTGLS